MRKAVMRVIAFAGGQPCPIAGQYLEAFDFEAHNGRGFGTFTEDIKKAMRFDNAGHFLQYWKTTSKTRPIREDGKPNRPLTATTVSMEWVDD